LNCEQVQAEISAYLNRDVEPAVRDSMDAHLVSCEPCSDELEYMRLLVAALPGLPAAKPPDAFKASVLARWAVEKGTPATIPFPDMGTPATTVGVTSAAAAAAPLSVPAPPLVPASSLKTPSPVPSVHAPAWAPPPPPHRAWWQRAYAQVGAGLCAGVLLVRMLSGGPGVATNAPSDFSGMLRSKPLPQIAQQALPVNFSPTTLAGRPRNWQAATVRIHTERPLDAAELSFRVPPGLVLDSPQMQARSVRLIRCGGDAVSDPRLIVLPQCTLRTDNDWEGQVRWMAQQPGSYDSEVELRCDGVYQTFKVRFDAMANNP
jgi:hypothetical protein